MYTACYASPEQLLGYPGKPADVWAVGRTLLAMLTGTNALAYVKTAQIVSWAVVGARPVSTAAVSHNILQNISCNFYSLQHLTCGTAASFAPGSAHARSRHPWNAGVWHQGGPDGVTDTSVRSEGHAFPPSLHVGADDPTCS